MNIKDGKILAEFMDKELENESFIIGDSWQTLMDIAKEVVYYEQTYAYDGGSIQKDGKCVFENITEALLEMDRLKFEKSIIKAVKWLNKKRK